MGNIKKQLRTALRNPSYVSSLVTRRISSQMSHLMTRLNGGKAAMPETVNIYPTDRCNLNCSMCFEKLRTPRPELAVDKWMKILNDIKRFRPRIHLSGGEPFLYKDINTLIATVKKHNLFLAVTTNGTFLQKNAEVVMKENINHLTVSIDGPAPIHDRIRGVTGTYDRIIAGLEEIQKRKKSHQLPILRINSMINVDEPQTMSDILDIARQVGADYVQFLHPLFLSTQELQSHAAFLQSRGMNANYWQGADAAIPAPKDIDSVYTALENIADVDNITVEVFPRFTHDQFISYYTMSKGFYRSHCFQCRAMWNTATILPNGDIESCPDYIVGSCIEKHFAQSWNNALMRQLRQRIYRREFFSVCRACCFFYM